MEYTIKLENQKKIILFPDERFIGLQEVLNTISLYSITLDDILEKIDLVDSGIEEQAEIGTERAIFVIKKTGVEIYDLFEGLVDDSDVFPSINISIPDLKKVIKDYINFVV